MTTEQNDNRLNPSLISVCSCVRGGIVDQAFSSERKYVYFSLIVPMPTLRKHRYTPVIISSVFGEWPSGSRHTTAGTHRVVGSARDLRLTVSNQGLHSPLTEVLRSVCTFQMTTRELSIFV